MTTPKRDFLCTDLRYCEGLQLSQLIAGGTRFDPGGGQYKSSEDEADKHDGDCGDPGDLNGCGARLLVCLQNDHVKC
jgi:hypothetical protein